MRLTPLLFVATFSVACQSQDSWHTFTSSRGGFTVRLPRVPFTHVDATVHRPEDVQSDGSLREGAPFVSEETQADRGDDGVYTIRWYEVPLTNELSDRQFLERLLATRKLGPVVPRWIHLGPFQGMEYERIEPSHEVRSRNRMFVIEGRVFHLWADNWLSHDDEASAHCFLESFQLKVRPYLAVSYDRTVAGRRP